MISDSGFKNTIEVDRELRTLRLPLTSLECDRIRQLGRIAVHAVEATAMSFKRGQTEAEVAGEVAHRLIKRTVVPERIQVTADGRCDRYRHWSYGDDVIKTYAQISCIAQRWGLNVGVTRTVAFESIPDELRVAHQKAVLMHATGMFFSRAGLQSETIWKKVHRIYEKFGLPHEWKLADQVEVIGYKLREWSLVSEPATIVETPVPIFWHPSIGPAQVGDTILVIPNGTELLTQLRTWPRLTVHVRNSPVHCADILIRNPINASLVPDQQIERVNANEAALLEADFSVASVDSSWEIEQLELPS